jgi:hypothetical protein
MTNLLISQDLSAMWCAITQPWKSIKIFAFGQISHSLCSVVKSISQYMHLYRTLISSSNRSSSFFINNLEVNLSFLSFIISISSIYFVRNAVYLRFSCNSFNQRRIQAIHIYWESNNVLDADCNKGNAFLNKGSHLQEIRWYKNRNDIINF